MNSEFWARTAVTCGIGFVLKMEVSLVHAAWKQGKLLFRFGLFFRFLLVFGIGVISYYGYRDWAISEWWLQSGVIGFILWFLFIWPPVVALSEKGIERRVWWRPKVFIPWDEVVDCEITEDGDMTIIGAERSIFCGRFQTGPIRFQYEVTHRSKVKQFRIPERFTGLHLQQDTRTAWPRPKIKRAMNRRGHIK